jgi:hypothetical protein
MAPPAREIGAFLGKTTFLSGPGLSFLSGNLL